MNNAARAMLKNAISRSPSDLNLILTIMALVSIRLVLYAFVGGGFHALPNSLCKFDCGWYLDTASLGYEAQASSDNIFLPQANWAFFPLFPMLIKVVTFIFKIKYNTAGLYLANICLCVFVFVSTKYLKLINSNINPLAMAIFLLAFPYSFYLSVPYTESLYAALAMTTFYLFTWGRVVSSSIMSALLSATRVTGVLLTPIIVFHYCKKFCVSLVHNDRQAAKAIFLEAVFPIAVAPLGLFCFMFYLYYHMGDAFAFLHVQRAWERSEANPFYTLVNGLFAFDLERAFNLKGASASLYALSVVFGAFICVRLLLLKRYAECWFLFVSVLVPLSAGLVSMQRYVFANPIFLVFLFDYLWQSEYRKFFNEIIFLCIFAQLYLVHLWIQSYVSLI